MAFKRYIINRRVINDLKKRSTVGIYFYMLVPYCIIFTDNYFERHRTLSLIFLGIFTSICLFRFLHLYLAKNAPPQFETLNNKIFITSVLLTALAWGAGAAYFFIQDGEPKAKLLMTICTAGFCSGGVVSFMPERRLALSYNFLMLLPAVITILLTGENIPVGIVMFFFSAYLCLITLRGNNEYWQALENEYLLEKRTEELKRESRIDVLTNLFNRRHFEELFHLAFGLCERRKTPITLMICDIDHFKNINDTFGHPAGDEYLKCISRCLKNVFQRETDVVARYGGEEFVILLPDEERAAACELAERFRNNVANTKLDYNGASIATTISLGMSYCVPLIGQRPDMLIENADSALYRAKNGGRNRIMIHEES